MTGSGNLLLLRYDSTRLGTRGILYLAGRPLWHTLEDPDRLAVGKPKVPGDTAIPHGSYSWKKTQSTRFRRILILIEQVPEFTGVRIHSGNRKSDTEGCPLIGSTIGRYYPFGGASVLESRQALDQLMSWTPDSGTIRILPAYPYPIRLDEEEPNV